MANTLKFGSGQWATKYGSTLAYNDENGNFKPLPFNFERRGNATRVNKEGLIEVVGENIPRIDYLNDSNGALLLEPSRTNLVTYSEDLSQLAPQSNVTISSNQTISPDGTLNASSLIDNSASGVHRAFTNYSSSIASGQLVSHSIFAKAKEHKWFQLSTGGSTNDQWANFDLENGVIGNSSSSANPIIENYGNGWYRCILFATTSANNATLAGLITLTNNLDATSRSPSYSGSNGGVYVFGLQIESNASYPTSYIKTQGSAVTRLAETCNNAGNSNVFNDSEGVLYAEVDFLTLTGGDYFGLNDGTNNQRVLIQRSTNNIRAFINSAVELTGTTSSLNNKIAVSYKANDYKLYLNGTKVATNTSSSVTPSGLNAFEFELGGGFGLYFYGNVKDIRVYNTALTDAELQALTQV